MIMRKTPFFLFATLAALSWNQAFAWTYTSPTATGNCGNLDEAGSASDFSFTKIVSKALFTSPGVSDVLKMAFVMPSETAANTDIIFIERFGAVKYYNAEAKTLTLIGTVTGISNATEDGLIGVAVERPFKDRVYLAYAKPGSGSAPNSAISGSFRLSRYSMNSTSHVMDMASEKVILNVPSVRNRWHTSGAMAFDMDGNLYWSIGDNETVFTGPGNTHDLRGGILRIHPNEDGSGYTIPKGNFAEYWAEKFKSEGRTTLSAKYQDTSKVRPEIFIKGTRNAYTLSVDPYRKHVVYSQCGPDYGGNTEMHHNSLTPAFSGWPFWSGSTAVQSSLLSTSQYGKNGSAEPAQSAWATYAPTNKNTPVNNWTGTMAGTPGQGVDTLPPAATSKYIYGHSCAMGSVIWHYDGRVKNPNKFPPQMENVWLMGDYNTRKLRAAKVDAEGNVVGTVNATTGIFTSGIDTENGISSLVDLQQGPDGALYAINLGCGTGSASGSTKYSDECSGILRIQYKGAACADTALHPTNSAVSIGHSKVVEHGSVEWVQLGPNMFSIKAEGMHSIRILNTQGREIHSMKGEGAKEYVMPTGLISNSVYFLEVTSDRGTNIRGFLNP
jgi:glucose/arabinose dehydrogenase